MPDCSKGLKSRTPARSGQAVPGSARWHRERCPNCELLEVRVQDAKQHLREAKKELRKKIRELRRKRESMNVILLTVIDIREQGNANRSRREVEIIKAENDMFIRQNLEFTNSIDALIQSWDEQLGRLDFYIQDEE